MAFQAITKYSAVRLGSAVLLSGLLITHGSVSTSEAAVSTAITSSGLGTTISQAGTTYNITGGTRPGGGTNLFHSFDLFNVGAGDTANFFNDTGLVTSNILGRVTGGNPSNIFGTIQTTGFGTANLFLINPAGVIFGPTASLNIGGSFHVSSADYIRFDDGGLAATKPRFYADPIQTSVLTAFSPDAFGFLNPNPAAIAVEGSTLEVPTGQTLSIIGGNRPFVTGAGDTVPSGVTATGGTLKAPSGQINLVSVASPGEVSLPNFQPAPTMSLGTINISQASSLDVSGDPGGTVLIRGGQFVLDNSTIAANTTGATNGAALAVDIAVTGDITINKTGGGPAIMAESQGAGNSGEIRISANNFMATYELDADPNTVFALIDTAGLGTGKAGNVAINAQNINVQGSSSFTDLFIDTSNIADGAAGDISITGGQVHLSFAQINGGGLGVSLGTGPGANIQITADDLRLDSSFVTSVAGQGGDITINAGTVFMTLNGVINSGLDSGGDIKVNARSLTMDRSALLLTGTLGSGPGGDALISVNTLDLLHGSQIASESFADGPAGQIRVTATERVTISDNDVGNPSGLFTSAFSTGNAGPITVTTPILVLSGGGRINSGTIGDGRGGDVTIVADSVSISGIQPFLSPDFQFSVFSPRDPRSSSIFTSTVGVNPGSPDSACLVRCGDAGNVTLSARVLIMGDGGRIDSGTQNQGHGGNITINGSETISLSGIAADGTRTGILSVTQDTAPGAGAGGNIALGAGSIGLNNGATVSAESSGTGNAGNILVRASDSFVSNAGTVTTGTLQSDGGNITFHVGHLVQLNGGTITTSVQGGAGNGGNITIDPEFVILQNGHITANAFGGNGGNISIVAGTFFADPSSTISASSALGVSGNIDIQSPVTSLSGTLAPLPAEIVQAASLLRTRCAAQLGGEFSSFVVAGREGLPLEPGGPLPSPLFVEGSGRLARSMSLPELRVGRVLGEPTLALDVGCTS